MGKVFQNNGKVIEEGGKILYLSSSDSQPPDGGGGTGPQASFTLTPSQTGQAPFTVFATSTSTGESLSHLWDWGDGSPAQSGWQNVPHTYEDSGVYIITLTVMQGTDQQTSQSTLQITVNPGPDPDPDPGPDPDPPGGGNATLLGQSNWPSSASVPNKDAWKSFWDSNGLGRWNFSGAQFTSSPITAENNILKIPFQTGDWGGASWQDTGAIIYQSLPRHTGTSMFMDFDVKFSSGFDWGVQGEQYRGGKFGMSIVVGSVGVGSNPGMNNFSFTTMWRSGGQLDAYLYWQGQSGNWPDSLIYHTIQDNTWYNFQWEIKINTPGNSDGHIKIWVDNILRFDLNNIQLTNQTEVTFTSSFGCFFGGDSDAWRARNNCDLEFTNMKVWDQRPT